MRKIGIVGAGVVGTAVGIILDSKGYEITGVYDINPESTRQLVERVGAVACSSLREVAEQAEILFVTTSDSAIGKVVEDLARKEAFLKASWSSI